MKKCKEKWKKTGSKKWLLKEENTTKLKKI